MKKIVILLLIVFYIFMIPRLNSQPESWAPNKYLIAGGVVAGAELVYIVYNAIWGEDEIGEDGLTEEEIKLVENRS